MAATDVQQRESLAGQYAAAIDKMEALRDGRALQAAAAGVADRLPPGRLALLSTSPEGTALAAVCAVARSAPTSWQLINLGYPPTVALGFRVVVIEPLDPGQGWQAAVRRHYPHADLVFADEAASAAAQAA
jgi:hypothetical protein